MAARSNLIARSSQPAESSSTPASAWSHYLSAELRRRLAGHGIWGPEDWRRLSAAQRKALFGVTRGHREIINLVVRVGVRS